jgi:hypothetical protein
MTAEAPISNACDHRQMQVRRVFMDRSRRRIEEAGLRRTGGAACRELSSSIFSRRAFSARSRASSAATAAGISVTPTPYAARGHAAHAGVPSGSRATHGGHSGGGPLAGLLDPIS